MDCHEGSRSVVRVLIIYFNGLTTWMRMKRIPSQPKIPSETRRYRH